MTGLEGVTMLVNQEIHLRVDENLLKTNEFEGFVPTLKETLTSLADKAPSDGHMEVEICNFHAGYKISIHLASSALDIVESAVAQSPFAALDRALLKLRYTLDFWAVHKNQN